MYDVNKYIARCIILAQMNSDWAKGINYSTGVVDDYPNRDRYTLKDEYIRRAICAIQKHKKTDFYFYIAEAENGYIVYFNFKDSAHKRYQVSFHNFDYDFMERRKSQVCVTLWDEKSSREASHVLEKIYNIKEDTGAM